MISTMIEQQRQEAVKATQMGMYNAVVWQQVHDVIIEIFADAATIEYVAKAGDEIFITDSQREFIAAIEYALDSIAF